jgi:hypothetical protein
MPIPSSHLLNLGLLGSVVVALFGMNYAVPLMQTVR